jgi:HSP20 family molecular chaperone IbpA
MMLDLTDLYEPALLLSALAQNPRAHVHHHHHPAVKPHLQPDLTDQELARLAIPLALALASQPAQRDARRQQVEAAHEEAQAEKRDFQAAVDVRFFKPEEVKVKLVGRDLVIEAEHEEREDEHGIVSRKLRRRYELPVNVDLDKLSCERTKEGLLKINAPRMAKLPTQERAIPIKMAPEEPPKEVKDGGDQKKE